MKLILASYLLAIFMGLSSSIRMLKYGNNIVLETHDIEEVILECPYELEKGDEDGLEVFWYFNNDDTSIYQWIPNSSKPQARGFLKEFIDLTYKSSDEELYRYKDLRLVAPKTQFTGKYKCKVSNFNEEKEHSIHLIVFSVPSNFELYTESERSGRVRVICKVGFVYPEPRLYLFKSIDGKRVPVGVTDLETTWSNGTYNSTAEASIHKLQLDDYNNFECYLQIPDTNIKRKKMIEYTLVSSREGPHGESAGHASPSVLIDLLVFALAACFYI